MSNELLLISHKTDSTVYRLYCCMYVKCGQKADKHIMVVDVVFENTKEYHGWTEKYT